MELDSICDERCTTSFLGLEDLPQASKEILKQQKSNDINTYLYSYIVHTSAGLG